MKNCSKCNVENPPHAEFCRNCGKSLASTKPSCKCSRKSWVLMIVLGILAVGAGRRLMRANMERSVPRMSFDAPTLPRLGEDCDFHGVLPGETEDVHVFTAPVRTFSEEWIVPADDEFSVSPSSKIWIVGEEGRVELDEGEEWHRIHSSRNRAAALRFMSRDDQPVEVTVRKRGKQWPAERRTSGAGGLHEVGGE